IGWLTLGNSPWVEQHLTYALHRYLSILSAIVAMVAISLRLGRARGALRHGLLLVVGTCLAAAVFLPARFVLEPRRGRRDAALRAPVTPLARAATPLAPRWARLRRRAAEAAMTGVRAQSDITPAGLRAALRGSLLDPTLELWLRDTGGGWLTVDGHAV